MEVDFRETGSHPIGEDIVSENPPTRSVLDRCARTRRRLLFKTGTDSAAAIRKRDSVAMGIKETAAVSAKFEGSVSLQCAKWYFRRPAAQHLVGDDHAVVFEEVG